MSLVMEEHGFEYRDNTKLIAHVGNFGLSGF